MIASGSLPREEVIREKKEVIYDYLVKSGWYSKFRRFIELSAEGNETIEGIFSESIRQNKEEQKTQKEIVQNNGIDNEEIDETVLCLNTIMWFLKCWKLPCTLTVLEVETLRKFNKDDAKVRTESLKNYLREIMNRSIQDHATLLQASIKECANFPNGSQKELAKPLIVKNKYSDLKEAIEKVILLEIVGSTKKKRLINDNTNKDDMVIESFSPNCLNLSVPEREANSHMLPINGKENLSKNDHTNSVTIGDLSPTYLIEKNETVDKEDHKNKIAKKDQENIEVEKGENCKNDAINDYKNDSLSNEQKKEEQEERNIAVEELKDVILSLIGEINYERKKLGELKDKVVSTRNLTSAKITAITDKVHKLYDYTAMVENESATLKNNALTLQNKYNELMEKMSSVLNDFSALELSMAEMKKENESLKTNSSEVQKDNIKLHTSLEEREKFFNDLIQQKNVMINDAKEKINGLEQKIQDLTHTLAISNSKLQATNETYEIKLEVVTKENNEIKGTLSQLKKQIEETSKKLRECNDEVTEFKIKNTSLTKDLAYTNETVKNRNSLIEEYKAKLEELETKNRNLNDSLLINPIRASTPVSNRRIRPGSNIFDEQGEILAETKKTITYRDFQVLSNIYGSVDSPSQSIDDNRKHNNGTINNSKNAEANAIENDNVSRERDGNETQNFDAVKYSTGKIPAHFISNIRNISEIYCEGNSEDRKNFENDEAIFGPGANYNFAIGKPENDNRDNNDNDNYVKYLEEENERLQKALDIMATHVDGVINDELEKASVHSEDNDGEKAMYNKNTEENNAMENLKLSNADEQHISLNENVIDCGNYDSHEKTTEKQQKCESSLDEVDMLKKEYDNLMSELATDDNNDNDKHDIDAHEISEAFTRKIDASINAIATKQKVTLNETITATNIINNTLSLFNEGNNDSLNLNNSRNKTIKSMLLDSSSDNSIDLDNNNNNSDNYVDCNDNNEQQNVVNTTCLTKLFEESRTEVVAVELKKKVKSLKSTISTLSEHLLWIYNKLERVVYTFCNCNRCNIFRNKLEILKTQYGENDTGDAIDKFIESYESTQEFDYNILQQHLNTLIDSYHSLRK